MTSYAPVIFLEDFVWFELSIVDCQLFCQFTILRREASACCASE